MSDIIRLLFQGQLETNSIEKQIKNLQKEIEAKPLKFDLKLNIDDSSLKSLGLQFEKVRSGIENKGIKFKIDTDAVNRQVDSIIAKYKNLDGFNFKTTSKDGNIEKLIVQYKEAEGIIKNINFSLNKKTGMFDETGVRTYNKELQATESLTNKQIQSKNKLIDLQNQLNSLQSKANGLDKGSGEYKKIEQEVQRLKNTTQEYLDTLHKVNRVDLNSLTGDIKQLRNETNQLIDSQKKVGSGLNLAGIAEYAATTFVLYKGLQELKNGINHVVELDTALVDLRKVTDEISDRSAPAFVREMNEMAKSVGHSTKASLDATGDFLRVGKTLEESKMLAKEALIYSNIGDIGIEDATKNIISTLQGFRLEADQTRRVIDELNEVGNRFAIDSGGLGEGLRRSASALSVANNSLEESVALVTAGNLTIQDPKVSGA